MIFFNSSSFPEEEILKLVWDENQVLTQGGMRKKSNIPSEN